MTHAGGMKSNLRETSFLVLCHYLILGVERFKFCSSVFDVAWEAAAVVLLLAPKEPNPNFGEGKFLIKAFDSTDGRKLGFRQLRQTLSKNPMSLDLLDVENGKIRIGDHQYRFDGKEFSVVK